MEVERGETTNQGRQLKTNKTKQTKGREMRLEGRDYSEEIVHLTSICICMYVCMCVCISLVPRAGNECMCVSMRLCTHTHTLCV